MVPVQITKDPLVTPDTCFEGKVQATHKYGEFVRKYSAPLLFNRGLIPCVNGGLKKELEPLGRVEEEHVYTGFSEEKPVEFKPPEVKLTATIEPPVQREFYCDKCLFQLGKAVKKYGIAASSTSSAYTFGEFLFSLFTGAENAHVSPSLQSPIGWSPDARIFMESSWNAAYLLANFRMTAFEATDNLLEELVSISHDACNKTQYITITKALARLETHYIRFTSYIRYTLAAVQPLVVMENGKINYAAAEQAGTPLSLSMRQLSDGENFVSPSELQKLVVLLPLVSTKVN